MSDSAPATMTLQEHLKELRVRVITALLAVVLGLLIGWWATPPVLNLLKSMAPAGTVFVQLTPGEALMATFRVALLLGLALASPVILYQTLRFVLPGLLPHERRAALLAVVFGSVLFAGGVVFAAWAVLPVTLQFLLAFGNDLAESQLSLLRYVGFCSGLLLLTGVLFELPLLIVMLALLGVVSSGMLVTQWRRAVAALFVVAAVLTPGQDPFSMLLVGLALSGLYLLSIVALRVIKR
jgi:sec-independent protein translocase protein TatC